MRQSPPAADNGLGDRPTAIVLRGLTKVYSPAQRALWRLDGSMGVGQLSVVVGPSGSGKTTLLRLLAGLERPSEGEIWWGDHRIDRWPPHRRRVSMVFQRPTLYPHLTVGENLQLRSGRLPSRSGRPHERAGKVDQQQTRDRRERDRADGEITPEQLARELGIEPLWQRFPDELSGGELQRAAIARAVVGRPRLLLLDEPLNHLDPPRRLDMRVWLAELHRRLGLTMVVVTHDPAEALMLGERIWVLQDGHLQQSGTPEQVYWSPACAEVARFFGLAGINLVGGQLRPVDRGWRFWGGGLRVDLERLPFAPPTTTSHEVVLGVRPEGIRMAPPTGEVNRAAVTRVDWLGGQSLVWVRVRAAEATEAIELRVLAPAGRTVQPGSAVTLELGSDRLCFFGGPRLKNLGLHQPPGDRPVNGPAAAESQGGSP